MLGYFLIFVAVIVGLNILLRNVASHEFKFTVRIKGLQFFIAGGTLDTLHRHVLESITISRNSGYLGLYLWTLFFEFSWVK
jgi:hypothetical protein